MGEAEYVGRDANTLRGWTDIILPRREAVDAAPVAAAPVATPAPAKPMRAPRVPSKKARVADIASKCGELAALIEELNSELQEWLDGMPESIRDGTKGESVESMVDSLTEVHDALEDAANLEAEW
jgi:hypothetical protein